MKKTVSLIIVIVTLVFAMCGCGEQHNHSYVTEVIPATCTSDGYTINKCACGDEFKSDIVPATGHSYVTEVIPATCTSDGYTINKCSCGDEFNSDIVPATGHSYVTEVIPATCTSDGYTINKCSCGDEFKSDITSATGHSGYYFCDKCNHSFIKDVQNYIDTNYSYRTNQNYPVVQLNFKHDSSTTTTLLTYNNSFNIYIATTFVSDSGTAILLLGFSSDDSKWYYSFTIESTEMMTGSTKVIYEDTYLPYGKCYYSSYSNILSIKELVRSELDLTLSLIQQDFDKNSQGLTIQQIGLNV